MKSFPRIIICSIHLHYHIFFFFFYDVDVFDFFFPSSYFLFSQTAQLDLYFSRFENEEKYEMESGRRKFKMAIFSTNRNF